MPLLDARLAVGAEADFGNAVAAAGSGLGGVELLCAEGLAGKLFRSAEWFRFARAELAGCAAFRVEGLGATWRCAVGTGARSERPSARCGACGCGTVRTRTVRVRAIWTRPEWTILARRSWVGRSCSAGTGEAAGARTFRARFVFHRFDAEAGRLAGDVVVVRSVVAAERTGAFATRRRRFRGSIGTESRFAARPFRTESRFCARS